MKISYGITVCNEASELQYLIEYIHPLLDKEDEIVVVYDDNRVTGEVLDVLEHHSGKVTSYPFDFQQDFLENKNYMNSKCTGDYIFQIDADEVPSKVLVTNLKAILEANNVDVLITPRVNLVEGLTQEYIDKWKWNVNDKGWVNWPDYQKRVYRNDSSIKWSGHKVHGMVEGYETYSILPQEEVYCIYHNKEIERQVQQNDRYAQIQKTL